MKQGELRRALLLVTLLCVCLLAYLYWQQSTRLVPAAALVYTYKHVYGAYR